MRSNSSEDGESLRAGALHCAFEEVLDQVHACERDWALTDRIDLAIRLRALRGEQAADELP